MDNPKYQIGDIVEMKKKHPCGSYQWKIIRIGADIKLKCQGCDHLIMIPRIKFVKSIKRVITKNEVE